MKTYHVIRIATRCNEIFTDLRRIWYPNDIKKVPKHIKLTKFVLANWFMCDGSAIRMKKRKNLVRIVFSTDGFSLDDVEFLKNQLIDQGYNCWIRPAGKGKSICMTKSDDVKRFYNLISDQILPSFKYKLVEPFSVR